MVSVPGRLDGGGRAGRVGASRDWCRPIRSPGPGGWQEFSFAFVLGVEAAGIRHRHRFQDFEVAAVALRDWETRYNYERFSLALEGRTPAEKLAALPPPRRVAQASHVCARSTLETEGQS